MAERPPAELVRELREMHRLLDRGIEGARRLQAELAAGPAKPEPPRPER